MAAMRDLADSRRMPVGSALGVEVDGSALWRHGFAGDARGGEGSGVGNGDVAVDALEEGGMARGDQVEILARGQGLAGPEGVVPATAGEPVAGGCGFGEGGDAGKHVGEGFGAGEVDVELGLACAAEVGVRVVESGKDDGVAARSVEVAEDGFWSGEASDFAGGPDSKHFATADGHGFHDARLVVGEPLAGVDDAIEEDDFGQSGGRFCGACGGGFCEGRLGSGKGSGGEEGEKQSTNCAHGRSLTEGLLLRGPIGHRYSEEKNATEAENAVLVAVPLAYGVRARTFTACTHGKCWNAERDGNVGVSRAKAKIGAQSQMAVDGAQGFEQWGIGRELRGRPVADFFYSE